MEKDQLSFAKRFSGIARHIGAKIVESFADVNPSLLGVADGADYPADAESAADSDHFGLAVDIRQVMTIVDLFDR